MFLFDLHGSCVVSELNLSDIRNRLYLILINSTWYLE